MEQKMEINGTNGITRPRTINDFNCHIRSSEYLLEDSVNDKVEKNPLRLGW